MNHKGNITDTVSGYGILECDVCGFKHLHPIPDQKVLDEFYRTQYYDTHKPSYIEEDQRDRLFWEIAYEDRIRMFEKYAPGKNLLDIGCGSGEFMSYAVKKGWSCIGIEPSDSAAEHGRKNNLDILNTTFNDFIRNNNRKFDVIHLKNVLEHVLNPIEIIEECYRILVKGGILYAEVPNDYEFTQRLGVFLLREKKSWLAIPDHINYFNFRSLKKLMRRNGFKISAQATTFPIYALLLLGYNFIRHKAKGRSAHNIRIKFEIFLYRNHLNPVRRLFYKVLSGLGLGRTVILYCKKTTDLC